MLLILWILFCGLFNVTNLMDFVLWSTALIILNDVKNPSVVYVKNVPISKAVKATDTIQEGLNIGLHVGMITGEKCLIIFDLSTGYIVKTFTNINNGADLFIAISDYFLSV